MSSLRIFIIILLTISFSLQISAQDVSHIEKEISELGTQAREISLERNALIIELNELVARLNIAHDEYTYRVYQEKAEQVDNLKLKLDVISTSQSQLFAEKKEILAKKESATLEQLTKAELITSGSDQFSGGGASKFAPRPFNISKHECSKLEQMRKELPHNSDASFFPKLKLVNNQARLCQLRAVADPISGDVTSITLENTYSVNTNPDGNSSSTTSSPVRQFDFNFEERSRQNIHLEITDDVAVSGRMSQDLMHKVMIFIPRKIFPYVEVSDEEDCCKTKVYLPTGEFAIFDTFSKEIIGGILSELPIDRSANRHTRNFARVEYKGNGITIEASRRAGNPQHTYTTPFNSNEHVTMAVIRHKGKVCEVSKEVIWENTLDPEKNTFFKYNTDEEFLSQVINKSGEDGCDWNLKMEDII